MSTTGGNKREGEVKVNDTKDLDQDNFGNFGAYVMQDDVLF